MTTHLFVDDLDHPYEGVGMYGFGECLPYENNRISLSKDKTDKWGLSIVVADAEFQENERAMRGDMRSDVAEMLEELGAKNIRTYDKTSPSASESMKWAPPAWEDRLRNPSSTATTRCGARSTSSARMGRRWYPPVAKIPH